VKISISKGELVNAINLVIRATASRPSVPSLSGILIETTTGGITLYASDLETSIKTSAVALVEEEGVVAVGGKIFSNIIKSLPETSVVLDCQEDILHITAGQSVFDIRTINPSDFSPFPTQFDEENKREVSAGVLPAMIKKVSKSVSRDETRAILTGVLLSMDGPSIKMVATDSYRLALIEKIAQKAYDTPFEVLVPGKSLEEVGRMVDESDVVKIMVSAGQILFVFGKTLFVTRRLEGKYPNYKSLIPREWNTKATITHNEILDSARRVSLLAMNNASVKMEISTENQRITLSSKSQDLGNAEEKIPVKVEGADNHISINYNYLIDGLSVVESEFITFEMSEPMKPGIIRAPEENFTYLVMPVAAH
jgi:DNA polymerase-3 subunit beta